MTGATWQHSAAAGTPLRYDVPKNVHSNFSVINWNMSFVSDPCRRGHVWVSRNFSSTECNRKGHESCETHIFVLCNPFRLWRARCGRRTWSSRRTAPSRTGGSTSRTRPRPAGGSSTARCRSSPLRLGMNMTCKLGVVGDRFGECIVSFNAIVWRFHWWTLSIHQTYYQNLEV